MVRARPAGQVEKGPTKEISAGDRKALLQRTFGLPPDARLPQMASHPWRYSSVATWGGPSLVGRESPSSVFTSYIYGRSLRWRRLTTSPSIGLPSRRGRMV